MSLRPTVWKLYLIRTKNFFYFSKVMLAIQQGIDRANASAVSNAARVQRWTILPNDVSVAGGELGPTLKLKRFVFNKKYEEAIENLYNWRHLTIQFYPLSSDYLRLCHLKVSNVGRIILVMKMFMLQANVPIKLYLGRYILRPEPINNARFEYSDWLHPNYQPIRAH